MKHNRIAPTLRGRLLRDQGLSASRRKADSPAVFRRMHKMMPNNMTLSMQHPWAG